MNVFKSFFTTLLDSNGWLIFLLYLLTAFFLNFTDSMFVETNELYSEFIQDRSKEKSNEYIADFEDDLAVADDIDSTYIDWEDAALNIVFILFDFLFSVPLVAGVIVLGFLFYKDPKEVAYRDVFKIVIIGNFVFLVPTLLSLFWFTIVKSDYGYNDIVHFKPLYLISLLDRDSLPKWSLGFINFINIYEVAFVLVVSFAISIKYSLRYLNALRKITIFYLSGIVIWNVFWIFIRSTIS